MRKRSLLLYLVLRHVVCFQIMPRSRTMAVTVQNRREILDTLLIGGAAIFSTPPPALAAEASKSELVASLQTARNQMDKIPDLIKAQQWDSVRAILITPPLSDLWGKKSEILLQYADVADDELAVLELKEDIQSHLRYLDMAVYNNVFNPIASFGETGATKQLIKSYYEDPINEYQASVTALEELIKVGQ